MFLKSVRSVATSDRVHSISDDRRFSEGRYRLRLELLIGGLIILTISTPLFVSYSLALDHFKIPTDHFDQLFSPTAKQDLQDLKGAQAVSLVFVLGGSISLLSGVLTKGRQERIVR